jgi:anaerobic selenocysteine-containing dehydrogenase
MHQPGFKTADGRAHFITHPTPTRAAGALLLTTVRSEGQFNSIVYERTDSYRNGASRWSVMMNAADLAAHGHQHGDTATLCSAQGRMENVTLLAYDIAPGSVMAYYPEANVLTGTAVDARSRTPGFKSTPVWLAP